MRKNLNKLATLALTGIMVAGMSFGAMAEDGQTPAANSNYTNVAYTGGKIVKEVKTDGKTFAPNTSFSFTLNAITEQELEKLTFKKEIEGDAKISADYLIAGTDKQKNGITLGNATFTAEQRGSGTSDRENEPAASGSYRSDATVSIKEGTFSKPGIYVFKLTETVPAGTDEDPGYEGVVYDADNTGAANTHYLLVEVRNQKDESGNSYTGKLKVEDIYVSNAEGTKETEIVNYYGEEEHDKVYDLTIEKLIEGLAADRSEKFNFNITVEQDGKSHTAGTCEKYAYYTQGKNEKTETYGGAITAGDTSGVTKPLGINDKLHIYGLSAGDKVTVKETSGTGYTKTYAVTGNTEDTDNVAEGTTLADAGADVYAKANDAKMTVTNTKNEITVTGVAMNIAPYAAMVLGAGAFAGIFLGGKRRKAEDED